MSLIAPAKLDFWLKNNYNVLFKGRAGVGKTSIMTQAFERNGLRWKYFSAATLDPWVDLIGVPKEKIDEHGLSYLDLIRPIEMAKDEIDVIFFDEFNRAPKKVRNAVMELMQFKSINGKKFTNLKMIWAAINPSKKESDDDEEYDVDTIDPAQEDRFQIIMQIPYKVDYEFFKQKYNENGKIAAEWWSALDEKSKNEVSPRRLDYLIDIYQNGGDMRDALEDRKINVSQLVQQLKNGSYITQMEQCFTSKDEVLAKTLMLNENFYSGCIKSILKNDDLLCFYVKFMVKEKLSQHIRDNKIRKVLMAKADYFDFKDILDPIISAHKAEKDKAFIKELQAWRMASPLYVDNAVAMDELTYINELHEMTKGKNTYYNKKILEAISSGLKTNFSKACQESSINNIIDVMWSSHNDTLKQWNRELVSAIRTIGNYYKKESKGTADVYNEVYNYVANVFNNHAIYANINRQTKVYDELKRIQTQINK